MILFKQQSFLPVFAVVVVDGEFEAGCVVSNEVEPVDELSIVGDTVLHFTQIKTRYFKNVKLDIVK